MYVYSTAMIPTAKFSYTDCISKYNIMYIPFTSFSIRHDKTIVSDNIDIKKKKTEVWQLKEIKDVMNT